MMIKWIGAAAILLIPFCAMAVIINGGNIKGADFTPVAYTPPVVIAPNQQGVAYKDTFTRANGELTAQNAACAGSDVCSWENVTNSARLPLKIVDESVTGDAGIQYRASMTKSADTLSQYVAAQIPGSPYRFHGVTLRGNGLVDIVDNRQFYAFRHNSRPNSSPNNIGADADAAYGIYLCRGNYDCGNGQSIYESSTQQMGVMNVGDSLGMEVNGGTGNNIVFKVWHWTVAAYPDGPPDRPWGTPNLTVCASGCDVVWTTPPESYTDALDSTVIFPPANTGKQGGFYTGGVASSTGFDNWMFGDVIAESPVAPPPQEGTGAPTTPIIITDGQYPSYVSGSSSPVLPANMTTSNSPAWGHLHPDCSVKYGTFPANPLACSVNNTLTSNQTYSNCAMSGTQTFAGNNITVECVRWDLAGDRVGLAGGSPAKLNWDGANKCSSPDGCKNIVISKVTMDGSYARGEGETGYDPNVSGSDFLKFSSTYQQTPDPVLSHTITIGDSSTYTTNFGRFVGFRSINTNKRTLQGGVNADTRPMFNYGSTGTKCSLQDDSTTPIGNIHVYCGEGTSEISTENGTLVASNVGTVDYATGAVTIFNSFAPTNATSLTLQAVAPSRHTTLIEKSLFQGNRVSIFGGYHHDANTQLGGADLSSVGYPSYSMVVSENIFRYPDYQTSSDPNVNDHMEHVSILEQVNGLLFRNNVFVCNENIECNNGIALLAPSGDEGYPHGVNNIEWVGNRFVGDSNGSMINLSALGNSCPTNQRYIENVFEDPQTPTGTSQYLADGVTTNTQYGVGIFSGACRPFLECDRNVLNGGAYISNANACTYSLTPYYQVASHPAATPTALPLYDASLRPYGYYPGLFSTGANADGSGGLPGGALGDIPYGQPTIPSQAKSDRTITGTITPSSTNNFPAWGHLHSDCVTEFGYPGDGGANERSSPTWAITDTLCTDKYGPSGVGANQNLIFVNGRGKTTVVAGSTIENCTLESGDINLGGNNITFSCMMWDAPGDQQTPPTDSTSRMFICEDADSYSGAYNGYMNSTCNNITLSKITYDGSWSPSIQATRRLPENGGDTGEPLTANAIVPDGVTAGANGRGGSASALITDPAITGYKIRESGYPAQINSLHPSSQLPYRRRISRWEKNPDGSYFIDGDGDRNAIGYYNYNITGSFGVSMSNFGKQWELSNEPTSILIEKSVFQGSNYNLYPDKIDGSILSYPGYDGYGMVVKENIFRWVKYSSHFEDSLHDHSGIVSMLDTIKGMLIKDNIFICDWEIGMVHPTTGVHNTQPQGCGTAVMMLQPSSYTGTGAGTGKIQGVDIIGNVFYNDDEGPAFSIGHPSFDRCPLGVRVKNNKFYQPVNGSSGSNLDYYTGTFNMQNTKCQWNFQPVGGFTDVISECSGNKIQYENKTNRQGGSSHEYNRLWDTEVDLTESQCVP
jgi:hypothetical protein